MNHDVARRRSRRNRGHNRSRTPTHRRRRRPVERTVLVPWVEPKFVPVIVTDAPTAPDVGDRLVMLGADTTVNDDPLLFTPLA